MDNILQRIKFNMPKDKKQLYYIIFIFIIGAIGIYLRIWWINNIPTEQRYDFATYQAIAKNIYNGKGHVLEGYPVAWQGSGYSYLLAFFYRLAGNTNEITGKYLNVILSSATLLMSFFIFNKFFMNRLYVASAFLITAFLPNLISYNTVLGTETLFLFLIHCILLVQLYARNKKSAYPILGIICGIATLTKPYMLAYPFILCVINWVEGKDIKSSLISFGTVMLACVIVIAPWSYRNYKLFGRLIPVSYNSGYVLYINNNDTNVTGSWLDLMSVETASDIKKQIEEYLDNGNRSVKAAHDIEPLLKSEAVDWIKKNPIEFLKLGFLRLQSTFFAGANDIPQWTMNGFTKEYTSGYWTETQYTRNMNVLQSFFDTAVYILSSAGFIFLLVRFKRYVIACFTWKGSIDFAANICFLNLAFFIAVDFVYEGQARYVFPVLIFMIAALVKIIESLSKEQ